MGILRAMLFMSVDGVVEAPEEWHFPYYSEEMGHDLASALESTAAMVLGRVTYEQFAAYWPHQPAEAPFADYNNRIRKLVVSTTLDKVDWNNSEPVTGDVTRTFERLKRDEAGDLHVTGSPTLVRWLLRAELLDELRLQVSPVLVGSGRRLFDGSTASTALELVRTTSLPRGVLSLTYRPVRG
jgi:dihydrofolate reductase